MEIKSTSIEKLEKGKPNSRCRKWRLWANTDHGRKSRRFTGSHTEAQGALEAFAAELAEQIPDSGSLVSYARSWQRWREKSGNFSPGTIANDKRNVNALARSPIATARVDTITPEMCREGLLWIKENPANGKELSNTTMNGIYIALHTIMAQAESDGRTAKNPMEKISPPRPDTKEREALSPDELMMFINRIGELPMDGHVMALYLIATLGLRRSEALGLAECDLANGFAHIRQAVNERTGELRKPKSEAGNRLLPIPPTLEKPMGAWNEIRRRRGFVDTPTYCCSVVGTVMRPQNLQKWWRRNQDALGCHGMTLHQLRHSNLSMMARHMSPFDLKSYAGWASLEPAKVYIHNDMDALQRASMSVWHSIQA